MLRNNFFLFGFFIIGLIIFKSIANHQEKRSENRQKPVARTLVSSEKPYDNLLFENAGYLANK